MPCHVCKHNQVKDIDRALLAGVSLHSLSQTYGFSPDALQFHQEQLRQKMASTQKRFHDGLRQGLFCKLNIVMEMVLAVVRGARAGEDFKLFLQASREFTRIITLMVKMDVHLEPEMIYCLMNSHQWDLQDNLLPDAFVALAKTRHSLKVNVYAPCPEPEPDPTPATAPDSPQETLNAPPDTNVHSNGGTGFQPVRAQNRGSSCLTCSLSGTLYDTPTTRPADQIPPEPPTGNRKTATANRPKNQREISAKLARKIPAAKQINKINQEDMVGEKNSPPKRQNLFRRVFGRWDKSGKLPGNPTFAELFIK